MYKLGGVVMYIKSMRLVNYRCIEDLQVNFCDGVNLIIGKNGAGKSSLLGGISIVLSRLFSFAEGIGVKEIRKDEIRTISTLSGSVTEIVEYCMPVSISCKLEFFGTDYEYTCQKDNEASTVTQDNYDASRKMKDILNDKEASLPLLSYLGDERQFFTVKKEVNRPVGQIERRQGYKNCLNGTASVDAIQDWCAQMDYAGYRLGHEAVEYILFKKIVSSFITVLEEKKNIRVEFSPKQNRLVYVDGESGYQVHNLSAGYQSALCLVMELAYRTALLNPTLDSAETLEGIVAIDEIDMHLHPRWQWKILVALRSTFPRVQFIIATHSPIVISSAEKAKLLLMKTPNEVKESPNAYGYNVGDVLELTQDTVEMPQELKNLRQEIEHALDDNDLAKAEEIIQSSAKELGQDSFVVQRLREFLEVNKWIVEE